MMISSLLSARSLLQGACALVLLLHTSSHAQRKIHDPLVQARELPTNPRFKPKRMSFSAK